MKKEIVFDPADYQYMDDMLLQGWIWEFIRRNKSYCLHFSKQEKNASYSFNCLDLFGLIPERHYKYSADDLEQENFLLLKRQGEYNTLYEYLPNPSKRYCDFGRHKPIIRGLLNVKIHDFNHGLRPAIDVNDPDYQKYCCTIVTNYLAINDPQDTLYLGISKNAGIDELKKEIDSILTEHIKSNRKKPRPREQWKSYLMAFDFKRNYSGILLSEMAAFFKHKYPRDGYLQDEKNLYTYYSKAVELVNGKYKKYLLS